jgi:DNA-binding GntR family transcriptional regulator
MQDLFDSSDEFTFTPELLCTKVFSFLRDAIVQGKIEPGEKLNVSFIASKLGLSRSPVREAIRILEAHNFVETLPQKGAYVREVTYEEISDLFVVEKSLLSVAVELTTLNMDEKERQELKSITVELKQVKTSKKIEAIIDASRRFHNFVAAHCGNKLLIKLYDSLLIYRERPYLLMREMRAEDYDAIIQEPIDVSMTMLTGDAGQSRSRMAVHMDNARERTLKAVSRKKRLNP